MSVVAAREFRSSAHSYQATLALVMGGTLVALGGTALFSLNSAEPAPWAFLFGMVVGLWVMSAGLLALLTWQRVRIGDDGQIEVQRLFNWVRPRRFHAGEVDALHYGNWQRSTTSVVSDLGVTLRASARRRWRYVRLTNTHVADGGALALFRAVAAAVRTAQPDLPLPVELAPDDGAAPLSDLTQQRP